MFENYSFTSLPFDLCIIDFIWVMQQQYNNMSKLNKYWHCMPVNSENRLLMKLNSVIALGHTNNKNVNDD